MTFKNFYKKKLINEALIKPVSDLSDLSALLADKDWYEIARGAYGIVYKKTNKDYILKAYDDQCYNHFLDFVEQNQDNPHVVKIKRRILKDDIGLVAIETLKALPFDDWRDDILSRLSIFLSNIVISNKTADEIIELFEQYVKTQAEKDIADTNAKKMMLKRDLLPYEKDAIIAYKKSLKRISFAIENHLNEMRTLISLAKYLDSLSSGCSFDLHMGNFLLRPSTGEIVVTDPIA